MSMIMDLFRQSRKRSKDFSDSDFWEIIDSIDHEYGGDSEAVLSSLVRHLKTCEDEYIFAFEDKLSELMYSLDGKAWADRLFKGEPFAEELFLCARCAAIAQGMNHYSQVVGHRAELTADNIYEYKGRYYGIADGLLTAASDAWARKHLMEVDKYPHTPKYPMKSHSNKAMWGEE